MNFRIGRISLDKYIQDIKALFTGANNPENETIIKLVNIHLAILSGKQKDGNPAIGRIVEGGGFATEALTLNIVHIFI